MRYSITTDVFTPKDMELLVTTTPTVSPAPICARIPTHPFQILGTVTVQHVRATYQGDLDMVAAANTDIGAGRATHII